MGVSVDSSYFQRLSLSQTLSRTVEVYCTGLTIFCQLAFLTVGIYAIVWAGMLTVLMPALDLDADQLEDPQYLLDHMGPFYAMMGISMLVAVLIGAIGNGAFVRAVADIYLKRDASLKTCINVGIQHACTILAASFLGFFGILIGLVLLYVPGIYLMVRWFLVNPVIVVEGLGATAALGRSWNLVSGEWCYVFCTYFIASFFLIACQLVWKSVLGLNLYTPMGSIMGSLPGMIFGPILAIMMTIMYVNLRVEKEGLNAELFARNLGESDGDAGETNYSSLINRDEQEDEHVISNQV